MQPLSPHLTKYSGNNKRQALKERAYAHLILTYKTTISPFNPWQETKRQHYNSQDSRIAKLQLKTLGTALTSDTYPWIFLSGLYVSTFVRVNYFHLNFYINVPMPLSWLVLNYQCYFLFGCGGWSASGCKL